MHPEVLQDHEQERRSTAEVSPPLSQPMFRDAARVILQQDVAEPSVVMVTAVKIDVLHSLRTGPLRDLNSLA